MADPTLPESHAPVVPTILNQDRAPLRASISAPLTSFVGRGREVRAVIDLLRGAGIRLITLTGPSGVGKTRLAIQVAVESTHDFPGGIWFVPLALIRDAGLVATTIGQCLDVRETAARTIEEGIQETLRDRRALLVLDNFEHILEAGPLVPRLLASCPRLTVLVTSRTVLNISGEHDVTVPPLAVPSLQDEIVVEEVGKIEAVRLFLERARAARADFVLTSENTPAVVAICAWLDGLPLAIELAAARVKVLPPPALLSRLERRLPLLTGGRRDGPARQRTMRDAIAWSYDLLTTEEQALFRRLAVFAGGCTLEAAEQVEHTSSPRVSVFDGIASLVDNSLLHQETGPDSVPRFQMLETIREFGIEQLEASGEAEAVGQSHARFFLALAERNTPEPVAANIDPSLDLLAADHDNLRVALDRLYRADSAERYLRLAAACAPYWYAGGHIREGWSRLKEARTIAGLTPTAAKGRVLTWAVQFAITTGNLEEAAILGREGLAVWEGVRDPHGRTSALQAVAMVAEMQLNWAEAAVLYEEVIAAWEALGERFHLGRATALRGGVAYGQGDLAQALVLEQAAAALFRELGNRRWTALADWYLGMFLASDGQFVAAARRYRDSARTLIEAGDAVWLFKPLVGLAAIAAQCRLADGAGRLLGTVDGLLQRTGARLLPFDEPIYTQAETGAHAALGEADFVSAHRAGRSLTVRDLLAEIDRVVTTAENAAAGLHHRASKVRGDLTLRELEVLRLIAEGRSDREIADTLCLSYRTVTSYVTSILSKLNVNSRTAAATHAVRGGLV